MKIIIILFISLFSSAAYAQCIEENLGPNLCCGPNDAPIYCERKPVPKVPIPIINTDNDTTKKSKKPNNVGFSGSLEDGKGRLPGGSNPPCSKCDLDPSEKVKPPSEPKPTTTPELKPSDPKTGGGGVNPSFNQ